MKYIKIALIILGTLVVLGFSKKEEKKSYSDFMKSKPMICISKTEPPIHHVDLYRLIENASIKTGLSVFLIDVMISVESGGDIYAKSPTGPYGLMQISRAVAQEYGLDRYDPYENVLAGSLYLRDMIDKFGSLEYGLGAYNLGPGGLMVKGIDSASCYIEKVINIYNKRREVI